MPFVVAVVALVADGSSSTLPAWKALVLGAVEGLTEYLPVSSTGHLLITGRLLGLGNAAEGSALATYVVGIQVGAIAAVLGLYRHRIAQLCRGLIGRDDPGRRLLAAVAIAFAPVALLGATFEPIIKNQLFEPWPVLGAWAVGGVALLLWRPKGVGIADITEITARQAAIIGLAQTGALWPGTSRSLVTLVAALAVGVSLAAAVEFSFLLGLATLTAATAWDLSSNGDHLIGAYGWITPLLGVVVAFVTAAASVRWMTTYLRHHELGIFGVYRLAIATATAVLLLVGVL